MSWIRGLAALLLFSTSAQAGLHYSGEMLNALPTRWPGFLMDHRILRNVARRATEKVSASPLRKRYLDAVAKLEKIAKDDKLTADQAADLGALHIRLGNSSRAIEVLRPAQRKSPKHFRLHANLAMAWQMQNNLPQATAIQEQAVHLAPKQWKEVETLHLKLMRLRSRERADAQSLDDLFGVKFVNDKGVFEPGRLAVAQKKRMPTNAVALTQQLALWLPADGRLLWQLAELAAVHGSLRTAAAMMDGCVTEMGLRDRDLRSHRQKCRSVVSAMLKQGPTSKADHQKHALRFKPVNSRPLANRFLQLDLPPISATGVNPLPWQVVTQTTVDRRYRPTFPKYLKQLGKKKVSLRGYIQPLGDDLEMTSFLLIEYPVGCWYCEIPEMIAMVYVELPLDKSVRFTRNLIEITGELKLNSTDPEDFLYSVHNAKVTVQE